MNTQVLGYPTNHADPNGTINEQLYNEFGNHLLTYKERLSTNVNSSNTNNSLGGRSQESSAENEGNLGSTINNAIHEVQSMLFSENEIFGFNIFSSSGFDRGDCIYHLPAFLYHQSLIHIRDSYFLRNIPSYKRIIVKMVDGSIYANKLVDGSGNIAKSGVYFSFILGTKTS